MTNLSLNWVCWLKLCLYSVAGLYHIHYSGACLMNIELISPYVKATEITIFAYSFPCFI